MADPLVYCFLTVRRQRSSPGIPGRICRRRSAPLSFCAHCVRIPGSTPVSGVALGATPAGATRQRAAGPAGRLSTITSQPSTRLATSRVLDLRAPLLDPGYRIRRTGERAFGG